MFPQRAIPLAWVVNCFISTRSHVIFLPSSSSHSIFSFFLICLFLFFSFFSYTPYPLVVSLCLYQPQFTLRAAFSFSPSCWVEKKGTELELEKVQHHGLGMDGNHTRKVFFVSEHEMIGCLCLDCTHRTFSIDFLVLVPVSSAVFCMRVDDLFESCIKPLASG